MRCGMARRPRVILKVGNDHLAYRRNERRVRVFLSEISSRSRSKSTPLSAGESMAKAIATATANFHRSRYRYRYRYRNPPTCSSSEEQGESIPIAIAIPTAMKIRCRCRHRTCCSQQVGFTILGEPHSTDPVQIQHPPPCGSSGMPIPTKHPSGSVSVSQSVSRSFPLFPAQADRKINYPGAWSKHPG